jgi:hypothetical protein
MTDMNDEPMHVATITKSESSVGWDGEHTESTYVVGALVQKDGETYDEFKARVKAKVEKLDAETYSGFGMTRKAYYGLESHIHTVFED